MVILIYQKVVPWMFYIILFFRFEAFLNTRASCVAARLSAISKDQNPSRSMYPASGNQTWQWKIPYKWWGFIGKSPINGPFSIAMFDYWRVSTSKLSVRMLSGESSGSLGRYNRLTERMAYLAITAGTL